MMFSPLGTVGQFSDAAIGTVIIVVCLSLIATMLVWSNRTIERIARRRLTSARDIARDLEDGA